ncbi:DUF397 domain-containing protein [Actinomadura atramentaria]|uniref:DUF397 domain-containing protein n=1 Tax=Actinomadura atramentaria TaxID=1990 RepID=UPI000A04000F|nr:DUF397 domain-containing protein [Actinomadura atramentaria]
MPDLVWRKSLRSSFVKNAECVEVARAAGSFYTRDSKDPDGPRHCLPLPEAAAFIAAVKRGRYDL